jgi:hypothetical protein
VEGHQEPPKSLRSHVDGELALGNMENAEDDTGFSSRLLADAYSGGLTRLAGMLDFVKKHLMGKKGQVVGPRTLRCLLFRYQLARDILSELGEPPNPRELANIVVSVYAGTTQTTDKPSRVEMAVRQVS